VSQALLLSCFFKNVDANLPIFWRNTLGSSDYRSLESSEKGSRLAYKEALIMIKGREHWFAVSRTFGLP